MARAERSVADAFEALLAFERGERDTPPEPLPQEDAPAGPELTPEMLDEIAARVADRLATSALGDQLKDTLAAMMREAVNKAVSETAKPVVSEVSERLVRAEIERIKNRFEKK